MFTQIKIHAHTVAAILHVLLIILRIEFHGKNDPIL